MKLLILFLLVSGNPSQEPPPVVVPDNLERLDKAVAQLIDLRVAEARARPRDASAHGELALVYEANNLWDEAHRAFEVAAHLEPQQPLWRFHLALARRETGDFATALEQLRSVAKERPGFPPIEQRLGEALLESGDLEGAEGAFRRLIDALPQAPYGYLGLGDVLLRRRDAAAAVQALERAVDLAPGYRTAHYLLGTAYIRLGRRREAERELARGVGGTVRYLQDPLGVRAQEYAVSLTARIARAGALLGAGQPRKAAEILEAAQAFHPENVTVLNNLAIAQLRMGRLDDAEKLLIRARELDPAKFSTYLNLASWALRSGRLEQALEYADSAVASAPELAPPRFTRAQVLARSGRYEEALGSLAESLRRDAGDPQAMAFSGDLCLRLGRHESARLHYRSALEIDPDLLPALVGLARVSLARGDPQAAKASLEKARKLAPRHPLVVGLERELQEVD